MAYTVYKHTNKINNKVYVGITTRKPKERWGSYGNGYKNNAHFYSAIEKYGWENFEHEIIAEGLTKEEAYKKEIELITFYKSNDRKFGYNKSSGGDPGSGHVWTEEERKRQSEKLTGIKRSAETRAKISKCVRNRPQELREKFAKARTGKSPWNKGLKKELNPLTGRSQSGECRTKISKALKGKPKSESHKRALSRPVRNITTGEEFYSLKEAGEKYNVHPAAIGFACRKQTKTCVKCEWEYIVKDNNYRRNKK